MFKRNQYIQLLLIGVGVFIFSFFIAYFILRNLTPAPGELVFKKTGQEVVEVDTQGVKVQEENEGQGERTQVRRIQPTTTIQLLIANQEGKLIEEYTLDPLTLMSYDERILKQRFNPCELLAFSEEKVILRKTVDRPLQEPSYTLGVQEGMLCIIERGDKEQRINLGVDARQFSRQTYSALLKESMGITSQEKEKLLKNATYIETILQSYEEE